MKIVLLVGEFKPPTSSDFQRLRTLVNKTKVSKVIILLGNEKTKIATQEDAEQIWEVYEKHFKIDIDLVKLSTPISGDYLLNWLEENGPNYDVIYSDRLAGGNIKTVSSKVPTIEASQISSAIKNRNFTLIRKYLLPDELTETEEDEILSILGIQELKETTNLIKDYDMVVKYLDSGEPHKAKQRLAYMREMMGYPSAKEYKDYMKKLKSIRKFLDSDFKGKWKEVPEKLSRPVKKLYKETKVEFELDDDRIRAKDYILTVLRQIFPDDFEFRIDKKRNRIILNVPKKTRSKTQNDKEQPKGREKELDSVKPRDEFESIKGLHWRDPAQASRSIEKLRNANIPVNWKIRSLLPIINRGEGVINSTKDIKKKRNLHNGFKKILKYYNALKSGDEK